MKKVLLMLLLILLTACNGTITKQSTSKIDISGKIVTIDTNGNADLDISNTDFIAKGFKYGDSLNIEFENGNKIENVPYLSGMYVEYGETMVYGKESKDKVSLICKYKSFDENYEVAEGMSYAISLNKAKEFSTVEEVGVLKSSDNFEDYNDEIKFANFREVTVGNIKPGRLYRSASPIDNSENRCQYAAKLALDNNIKTILNIIDKDEDYQELIANLESDSKILFEKIKTIRAPISADYQDEENNKMIVKGFTELINNDYPYLIHCLQGKDRTGYVMTLIEALTGATYEEIVDDFMVTYDNYYDVNKQNDTLKYDYIKKTNVDAMLKFITGSNDIEKIDLAASAKEFLLKQGTSEENINSLINKLCD